MRERTYYPNLNGLRAVGAFIVVSCHLSLMWLMWGIDVPQLFPIPGKVGVALFFALSGFLISSLLFIEQNKAGTIRLKAFYLRRILRIWPLYYLILILGLFVFNRVAIFRIPLLSERMMHDLTWVNILSVLFIIPNFTHLYIPFTDQRWSIVVEEMFYLVQPALVRTFRNKYFLIFLFCGIFFSSEILSGLLHALHWDKRLSPNATISILRQLEYLGCIATGCIAAALYRQKQDFCRKFLFSRWVQFGILVPLVVLCYISFIRGDEAYFDLRIYSALFAILVLNAALNPATIFRLENRVLNFLGKISYGIYMYHMFCLGIAFVIVRHWMAPGLPQVFVYIGLSIGLTILVSWLSFRYLESFFLNLNKKKTPAPSHIPGLPAEPAPVLDPIGVSLPSDNIRYQAP